MKRVIQFFLVFAACSSSWADKVLEEVHVKEQVESNGKIELTDATYGTFQEVLRERTSLQTTSHGGAGTSLLVSVRGASTHHTGVRIDGLEARSPLELGRFDFSKMALEDFEGVDLKEGPFGEGSSIGGTLALTTKQGRGKPRAIAKTTLGSLRGASVHSSFEGEHGKNTETDFYVGTSFQRSGEGRRHNALHGNFVSDESVLKSLTANVGHFFSDSFEGRLILSTSQKESLIDEPKDGLPAFSNTRQRTRFDRFSPQFFWHPCEAWSHELKASYTSTDLSIHSQTLPSKNHSDSKGISYGVTWHPQESLSLSASYRGIADIYKGSAASSQSATHHQLSTSLRYRPWKSIQVTGNLTGHRHDRSGRHVTQSAELCWQATTSVSFFIKEGQGIRFPTLVDLYGSPPWQQKNLSLQPEKSTSYEVGTRFKGWDKKVSGQVSVFQTHIRNFIAAEGKGVGVYTTRNRGKRRLEGVEAKVTVAPARSLSLDLGYSYTRALPDADASRTIRLARHKGHAALTYRPLKGFETFVEATYHSARQDLDFRASSEKIVDLGAYTTIRAGVDYSINKTWRVFGRLENAFDARYEDVFGYGARGREILIGVKVTTP